MTLSKTPRGPLVIGAGLMRTGTNSQMKALEILLGGRCYHMEVIMKEKRWHLKLWHQAATQGLTKELADEIFDGFCACTDFPACHFYQELAEIYPDAKFVLSVRDPQRWVQSVRATIFKVADATISMLPPVRWILGIHYMAFLWEALTISRFGLRLDMTDKEMAQVFDRHTESVMQAIPKERLLVYSVSDGWEPLCEFLGVPVPDVPFPNVNDTKEFQRRTMAIRIGGAALNFAFCAAVGSAVWFGAKFCLRRLG